ncbi:MAG: SPOR domain-containing protein [Magnetococcales bacterium]|nr:SPOR domain-containing protein [Magnetococcales bacterium]
MLFSTLSYAGPFGKTETVYRPPSMHYYSPDKNPEYTYQSTGNFAKHPVVMPKNVPVISQNAYYYMTAPQTDQINIQSYPPQSVGGIMMSTPPRYSTQQTMRPHNRVPMQQQMAPQQHHAPRAGIAPQQYLAPRQPMMGQANTGNMATQSYSLHVGSYLVYSKADELEEKVKALGLKSYRKEVAAEGIRYLQLRVGPFRTKTEMRQAAAILNENKIKNRIAIR